MRPLSIADAIALSRVPEVQAYVLRRQREESEDYEFVKVLACYGMQRDDALAYAREARASIGAREALVAAYRGAPYMLPVRNSCNDDRRTT